MGEQMKKPSIPGHTVFIKTVNCTISMMVGWENLMQRFPMTGT